MGLEPTTPCLQSRCSSQLSYVPGRRSVYGRPLLATDIVRGMPAVFVHGNPETPAVWKPLVAALSRDDVVCLQLPGFGVPEPEGFGATKDDYADWLTAELEKIGEPVDLVGHDWGGGFVLRVACTRPELLRSWASDVAGMLDPGFVWHDLAQIWQTEGAGEDYFAAINAQSPEDLAALLAGAGIPEEAALDFARATSEEMGRCVLALYRSAAQPRMQEWAVDAEKASARPGLVLIPTADPFTGGTGGSHKMATVTGAKAVELDGLEHWWMLQDPAHGARVLEEFWASV
jgi:pimeloyl-ACP methyl ester carboxylesterase